MLQQSHACLAVQGQRFDVCVVLRQLCALHGSLGQLIDDVTRGIKTELLEVCISCCFCSVKLLIIFLLLNQNKRTNKWGHIDEQKNNTWHSVRGVAVAPPGGQTGVQQPCLVPFKKTRLGKKYFLHKVLPVGSPTSFYKGSSLPCLPTRCLEYNVSRFVACG